MGQRTATQSVAAVMIAFLERKTWSQAELARATGLRIELERQVRGPIALGYGSHFGLGLFVPQHEP
jgi:CRISPR-associated protein Csb2